MKKRARIVVEALLVILVVVTSFMISSYSMFWMTWNAPVNVWVISATPVHNVNTGMNFTTIQDAINSPSTLAGHTILCETAIYSENVVVNKSVTLLGIGTQLVLVDGSQRGSTINVTADDVTIRGFTAMNSSPTCPCSGIFLKNVRNTVIQGNNASANMGYGIFAMWGHNNSILDNLVCRNNLTGIRVDGPEAYATVARNVVEDNQADGIFLYYASNVLIDNNTITGNEKSGITPQGGSNNTIMRNNLIVDNGWNGIFLYASNNNTIEDNTITENGFGQPSEWKLAGVAFGTSNSNIVVANRIAENKYGVMTCESSHSNKIYHNAIENNTQQVDTGNLVSVWDDGYPSGGNYWSDYSGVDSYSGPFQNETGSDGIWDQPYVIDLVNTDHYPLTRSSLDREAPVVSNVRHTPLYPNSTDVIHFLAEVTDNVGVASASLNLTEDHVSWSLILMESLGNDTFSASLGPFPQGRILGFYVIAYDFAGNKGFGSEIVPPLPEPPKAAPVLVSDTAPNPLPDGKDVSYDVSDGWTDVFVNVTEVGIYDPTASYHFNYSIDGGVTWITGVMTYVGDFIWRFVVDATTNIIFKIGTDDGSVESEFYWIIVAAWKYPVYLYFSTNESYYPVQGLDFDFAQTGNHDVENNKASYDAYFSEYRPGDLDGDSVPDAPAYTFMNPRTLNDGCLVIEYWLYYAFNPYPILDDVLRDDHEHDFEPIYLWIDLATGNIKKMACGQHNWVNHYEFNVQDPPSRINLAVEEGGHGTAMLYDGDKDGFPDLNLLGHYDLARTTHGDKPFFWAGWLGERISPASFVASLHPWVTYDPRIPSSELHLFDDVSILTAGLDWNLIIPQLSLNLNDVAADYDWLTGMLGKSYLLKTNFAAKFLLDSGFELQFLVSAPLYREEFREPAKLWNKVSWGWWATKQVVKLAITAVVLPKMLAYFGAAGALKFIASQVIGGLTKYAIDILFDPVQGSVIDQEGNVLGYSNVANSMPRGAILATRNMTGGLYDLFLVFTNSSSDYVYEVHGTEANDTYNFTVSCTDGQGYESSFNAVELPIGLESVHRFSVNWTRLDAHEPGVEVWIDQDGDGYFEHQFVSDSELTGAEFEQLIAHDVAVVEISTSKSGCLPKETVGEGKTLDVNVTVQNQGESPETFNLTIYANGTQLENQQVTMDAGTELTLTFHWSSAGYEKGYYWLNASVTQVFEEIDLDDNILDYGGVLITLTGDVDGDRDVDIFDIVRMAGGYGSLRGQPKYNPNCDIDNDDDIDIFDIVLAAGHYSDSW